MGKEIQEETVTESVVHVVKYVIAIATPKASVRGKNARNKLTRAVIEACKELMYDKRFKKGNK